MRGLLLPFAVTLLGAGSVHASAADDWALLGKAAAVARTQPLAGSYLHQVGSAAETFRIERAQAHGKVRERRVSLDGLPREVIRNGDAVVSAGPDPRALQAAKASSVKLFPALLPEGVDALQQGYTLTRLGQSRVAMRDCQWLELKPREAGQRYALRLCVDGKSHLPLKTMTLTPQGQVVESFSFIDLNLNVGKLKVDVKPAYKLSAKSSAQRAAADTPTPALELRGMPAGFTLVQAGERRLPGDEGAAPVQHFVYSDGLVMLSVFAEPGAQARTTGAHGYGALSVVSDPEGDYQLTLVGELPEASLAAIARGLRISKKP
ncbi:MucB/RseB C-terminal domain-containing protein [Crenobacter caeni]|uniref:Transcriptional regulator n=1 Tax=Crenobacter caeni TaxID=2705474 RepID=A0A6B2KVB0_9NEIS|nr:MucB/RseB C-terminal domain-containing protein [Crenobacter caeni]NDV13939.1 transcriptional regulator [Crenobacter caeni]